MKKNIVGPRIKELREQANPPITQADLAARLVIKGLNIDRSAISRIEKQERQVTDREIIAIAKALRFKPADLFK